jgi:AcrR family transcriptional regulator
MSTSSTPSPRRLELERVATRLFAQRGYHATSMEDLAKALGMRRGSLYTHITAKEELLLATVERGAEAFSAALGRAEATEGTPLDRVQAALRGHIGVIASEPDAAACFLWEWRHLGQQHRADAVALRDAYEHRVRDLFRAGVAAGALRADLDVPFAALALLSVGNWASTWLRPRGRLAPEEIADRFFAVLALGVAAPQLQEAGLELAP